MLEEEPLTEPAGDVAVLRPDTLADSVLMLLMLTVVQRLVGFGRGLLVCRWLDPDELGRWEMGFSFLAIAAPLALLGLPGSFGRYVEHYSQKGLLKTYLRRTIVISCFLGAIALLVAILASGPLAEIVFGSRADYDLMVVLAVMMAFVIAYNFMTSLCTALRMYRVFAGLQFASAVLFAAITVVLLLTWRMDAASVIAGYGLGCLLATLGACAWLRGAWRRLPTPTAFLEQRKMWRRLLPFALWLWTTDLIGNIYSCVDRYMVIHYSGTNVSQSLASVGQYHTARIVPVLLATLCTLLANMITPHLARHWETGQRDAVVARLNVILKMLGVAMVSAGMLVLWLSPLLFDVFFHGKFTEGLRVLPGTLTYCLWMGLGLIAQNYLWCAEKAWLGTCAILGSLVVNVTLNLIFLPMWGLEGAVTATIFSDLMMLLSVLLFSYWLGMRYEPLTLAIMASPAALSFGPLVTAIVLGLILLGGLATRTLLTEAEWPIVSCVCSRYADRLDSLRNMLRLGAPS